jgi:hypothetical protein
MEIRVYRARAFDDVPQVAHVTFDGMDDRYYAAFENYPDTEKLVIVGWGTTGEVAGEPLVALVATVGHIITGYIDDYFDVEVEPELWMLEEDDIDLDPIEHDEPSPARRMAGLLARLRKVSPTQWLLVHDADWVDGWVEQGFRVVAPPPDIPADEALLVLAWGELPEDVYALMRARGLSWHLGRHRYPSQYANEE